MSIFSLLINPDNFWYLINLLPLIPFKQSNNGFTYLISLGIVGEDGKTHQGVFDVSLLYPIDNSIVAMPALSIKNVTLELILHISWTIWSYPLCKNVE